MKNGEIAAETARNRCAVPPLVCDLWRLCSADQRIFTKSLFGGDFPGTFLVGAFSVGIDEGDFDTERTRYHHARSHVVARRGRVRDARVELLHARRRPHAVRENEQLDEATAVVPLGLEGSLRLDPPADVGRV